MARDDVEGLRIAEAILGASCVENLYKLELVLEAGHVPHVYATYRRIPQGDTEVIETIESYTLVPAPTEETTT